MSRDGPKPFASIPSVPLVSTDLARPEKLVTQMGATAGSGSGDFHVYRAQRRREMFRLEKMDKDAKKVYTARLPGHACPVCQQSACLVCAAYMWLWCAGVLIRVCMYVHRAGRGSQGVSIAH